MNFKIQTIPHYAQRYDTVGDYFYKHLAQIEIRVSDFSGVTINHESLFLDSGDVTLAEKYEFLVALHEFIEAFLCYQAKIPYEAIDKYDQEDAMTDDPGDEPEAPYHRQHVIATAIEQQMAAQLGVDWTDYENAVRRLSKMEQEKESTT